MMNTTEAKAPAANQEKRPIDPAFWRTPAWAEIRRAARDRYKQCARCASTYNPQEFRVFFTSSGMEKVNAGEMPAPEDCVPVCVPCFKALTDEQTRKRLEAAQ